MAVGTRQPARRRDDLGVLWREVGTHLVQGQGYINTRLDRLENDSGQMKSDIAELKADVAQLKVDVAQLKVDVAQLKEDFADMKGQLNRLEAAFERGFSRIEMRFEELIPHILRGR